jgi:hypothetical protein
MLLRSIGFLLLALSVSSCSKDPRDTSGHLQPGNSIRVASQALGSGGGGGVNDGATIGSVPFIDWNAPNIPVMQDGVIDHVFVWSAESNDGEAQRQSHYVVIKVQEQSYTNAHRHRFKSLLNDAENVPRSNLIPNSARLKQQPAPGGMLLPRVGQSGPQQTRLTVAELDANGNPRVIGTTRIPVTPSTGSSSNNGVTTPQVQEMLDYFNTQQRARGAASQSGSGSASSPPGTGTATPIPGTNP